MTQILNPLTQKMMNNTEINTAVKRHKWDNPKDKTFATCIRCGCMRFYERFSGRPSWVYVTRKSAAELTSIPPCSIA